MTHWVVYGTMIFMLISRAVVPSYGDIMYYFFINVLEFNKTIIALLSLIAFTTAIFGSFIYNLFLKKLEFRVTMFIAHIIIGFAIMSTYLLVSRISKEIFGINDILFAFFTDAALDILFVAFIFMPMLVAQTKIVPKNVEGTIYSVFSSIRNLANDTISPVFGGLIATHFKVTRDNFDNISSIVLIQFACNLIPICFIWLLPNNQMLEEFSQQISEKENEEDKGKIIDRSYSESTTKKLKYQEFDNEMVTMSKDK
mmetsp:Transcript_30039/g.26613  ORF Transcript_30039/g.26613 Transcript_30039/m.26613 type:complete len:255 (+) Transcript_30039:737-1501(+)